MATQSMAVDASVQDATAELSLGRGDRYTVQNIGPYPIRLSEQAAAPGVDESGIMLLAAGAVLEYTVDASENLYVWLASSTPGASRLAVTPA